MDNKISNDYVERLVRDNNEQAKEIWQQQTMIGEYMEEIEALEERLRRRDYQHQELLAQIRLKELEAEEMELEVKNLAIEMSNREDDYGELLNQSKQQGENNRFLWLNLEEMGDGIDQQEEEIKRLERKLEWADSNLMDKMMKINRYGDLVDDLMKVISILIGRTEQNE